MHNFNHRATRDKRRMNMQNEPNSNRDLAIENCKSLQLFTRQMRTFTQKCKKTRNFCKLLKLTHLTQCTTKTYKTVYPRIRGNGYERKTTVKMQNKPNFKLTLNPMWFTGNQRATRGERQATINMQNKLNSPSRIESQEYAKQTQFQTQRRSEAQIRRRRTHPLIYSFTHLPKYAKRTQSTYSYEPKP
jgi:hypothetical protein